MKFSSLFACSPLELAPAGDPKPLFRRFCDEQPNVIAYLTKYGIEFTQYASWTSLTVNSSQMAWLNYIGHGASVPPVKPEWLEHHHRENIAFVAEKVAKGNARSMAGLKAACDERPQSALRMMMFAGVLDASQSSLIDPVDTEFAPELVQDQNLAFTLIGTVLDSIDSVAVDPEATAAPIPEATATASGDNQDNAGPAGHEQTPDVVEEQKKAAPNASAKK